LDTAGRTGEPAASKEAQLFNALPARSIGPASMGGRITDVAVVESDLATMYVATATGGLWKTTDAGNSWRPVFDGAGNLSIGDVAIAPSNRDIVWVGTGEANILRSVSVGDGVYKSIDGGQTWKHMGLKESRHVGRIVIHPKNPDIVYVAALGRAWGPNEERGLFKTTDGGKTWQQVLYLNENTGVIDVAMDPSEPDILIACAYHFRRDAFSGTTPRIQWGPGSGLYRSEDGGKNWSKLTDGLPDRPLGRCGIDFYRKNPNVIFAIVQTDLTGTKGKDKAGDIGGIYRSEDKGMTWKRVTDWSPPSFFHFYFGQIRVDPNDDQRIYTLGIAAHVSTDGGKTFNATAGGTHADHHALWINPKDSDHLVLGNDGGLFFSKNRGKTWLPIRGMAIAQFYGIGVDMRKPYRVYGGMQDTGSWGGPSATYNAEGITLADWRAVGGGDGFYCQVDPTDPDTVYCEQQYGVLKRVNLKALKGGKGGAKGASKDIHPKTPKGEAPYRFNWNSPILLSPHNPNTIYFGGNFLFKSTDRGDKWETISPDLSRGAKEKDTGHTITTIAESPLRAGLLWAGTDDGRVHVSKNDGKDWTEVTAKIPQLEKDGGWITRVECSHHAEGTAYVSVDRHRNDDLKPYMFKTTDHGATWQSIAGDLPKEGNIHVVRESLVNPNLLFAGTEFGLYGTLDGGKRWHHMKTGLPPAVLVHDLVIHPRERDLVVGTHGRSIYVIDIAPLEEMTAQALAADVHLCKVKPAVAFQVRKAQDGMAPIGYRAANPPYGATVYYHLKETTNQPVTVFVLTKEGKTLATLEGQQQAGLHKVIWDLRGGGALVTPGDFTVRLQVGDRSWTGTVSVDAEEVVNRRLRA
jgi:photosystem II stability/assembly factor-like uncharacterized protein